MLQSRIGGYIQSGSSSNFEEKWSGKRFWRAESGKEPIRIRKFLV